MITKTSKFGDSNVNHKTLSRCTQQQEKLDFASINRH